MHEMPKQNGEFSNRLNLLINISFGFISPSTAFEQKRVSPAQKAEIIKRECPLRSSRIENSWHKMKNLFFGLFHFRFVLFRFGGLVSFHFVSQNTVSQTKLVLIFLILKITNGEFQKISIVTPMSVNVS